MAPKNVTNGNSDDIHLQNKENEKQALRDARKTQDFNRGMSGAVERPLLDNILLHIIIRIKYFIHSGFCLIPILSSNLTGYRSPYRPKDIPELDYFTKFGIRMCWLVGSMLRKYAIFAYICIKLRILHRVNDIFAYFMKRAETQMEESGYDFTKVHNMPLPEYDWQNGSPREFYEKFVKNPHPVVLRGFIKDNKIMQYSFDYMIERWGDEQVLLSTAKNQTAEAGAVKKLREVKEPGNYLVNSEVLFNKYPELWEALDTPRLEPYINKKSMFVQMFMGCQGTGSRLHSAHVWNFFHMVDGCKRWYFIDPYDWYFAFPIYGRGFNNTIYLAKYPDDYDPKLIPAFKYCPYYYVDLQPGDVMLNPPWWGHGIKNISEKSVGMATRWCTNGIYGGNLCAAEEDYEVNRFASFIWMTGIASIKILHDYLREINPKFDEHAFMTKREVEATRFKPRHKAIFVDGKSIDGWYPMV